MVTPSSSHCRFCRHHRHLLCRRLRLPLRLRSWGWAMTAQTSGKFQDGGKTERIEVPADEADWSKPNDRPHRAVNIGRQAYAEITIFFLDRPDAMPQPRAEPE